jgi:hypothetical protein
MEPAALHPVHRSSPVPPPCHRRTGPLGELPAKSLLPPFHCSGAFLISGCACRTLLGALPTTTSPPFAGTPPSTGEIYFLQCCATLVLRYPAHVARCMRHDPQILGWKISSPLGHRTTAGSRAKSWLRAHSCTSEPGATWAGPAACGPCGQGHALLCSQAGFAGAGWPARPVSAHGKFSNSISFLISRNGLNSV